MSEQNIVESNITGGITGGSLPKLTAQQKFLNGKEEEYTEKYNGTDSFDGTVRRKLDIIPGSAAQDLSEAGHEVYKNKVRLKIRCECGVIYERATSDLHTTLGCPACTKLAQKSNKKAKKGRLAEVEDTESPEEKLERLQAEVEALEAELAGQPEA